MLFHSELPETHRLRHALFRNGSCRDQPISFRAFGMISAAEMLMGTSQYGENTIVRKVSLKIRRLLVEAAANSNIHCQQLTFVVVCS